jgi:hemolysin activation/secretion protein
MIAALTLALCSPALATETQPPVDRSDPAIAVQESGETDTQRPARPERPDISAEAPQGPVPAQTVIAGAIRVEGAAVLPAAAFAPAIEPYLGRELSPEDLRRLAGDIAGIARAAGYGLATASIPRQSLVNGVLRVQLDAGRIDAIDARGPAADAVARRLQGLVGPEPVRTAALEHRLLVAGSLAGVIVGRARLVRDGARNVLRIETRRERVTGQLFVDNWGTSSLGPIRARALVNVNGLAKMGDQLTLGAMTTPLAPREFRFLQAGYSLPVGNGGTELSARAYLSRSAAGGSLRDFDLDGEAVEAELGLSHPLLRSRTANLWGYLTVSLRDSGLDVDGRKARDDRITTASAALYGWARAGGGAVRVRMALVRGLDIFAATRPGEPLASRRDGDGVFTKLTFWADYTRPLGGAFSLQVSGQGQLASRPLLASEEIGLGGRAFLRGYDYREFSGDRGAAGAAELRYDLRQPLPFVQRAQVYAYADGGRVTNLEGGYGSGALFSAGGGLRLWLPHRIEAGIELGVPLRNGFDRRRPDPRLSLTLAARF